MPVWLALLLASVFTGTWEAREGGEEGRGVRIEKERSQRGAWLI